MILLLFLAAYLYARKKKELVHGKHFTMIHVDCEIPTKVTDHR